MKTQLHLQGETASTAASMTAAEWHEFENDCRATMALGGERGEIAARMLDIGTRMRSLSAKVDAAIERYCS